MTLAAGAERLIVQLSLPVFCVFFKNHAFSLYDLYGQTLAQESLLQGS